MSETLNNASYEKHFDASKDKIAITIPKFKLLRNSELPLDLRSEPYIYSVAIDEFSASEGAVILNSVDFPRMRAGQTVKMTGDGHVIYGPKNPGSFVSYTIFFMESDKAYRIFGEKMTNILKDKRVETALKAISAVKPEVALATNLIKEALGIIALCLKENGDDHLFSVEGTHFRNRIPAYGIERAFEVGNNFIQTEVQVKALLTDYKGLGAQPELHAPVNSLADATIGG